MFESIRGALNKTDSKTSERLKDFLRPEPGNSYLVRLHPDITDPKKTFFHYYTFGWKSQHDGKNMSTTSLQTWDQPDPIAEERYRVYNSGTEAEKERIKAIRRSENWLVKVYVISDSKTPENNGTVKLLRFGKQLGKIVFDAIEGDGAEDFGSRVFDLSPDGCSLLIKVEQQGQGDNKYPTYVSSKFRSPKAIEDLTPDKIDKIYKTTFDLQAYVLSRSYDELKKMLDEHWHCKKSVQEASEPVIDSIPTKTVTTPAVVNTDDSEALDELLKDL